ncbi:MAG: alpha/beta hydrolase family protein [Gemmatimonadaceae bacterium]
MKDSDSVEWSIDAGGRHTTAVLERATSGSSGAVFVCAHGAGGHMADRGMLRLTETLRSAGLDVVRFNFFYRERGSKRPDPMPLLQECVAAVVARTRHEMEPRVLIMGGRSMGGRAASMLAARGHACDGLLLFAYPLHPAGKPDRLRSAHLPAIAVPVLCFNGTRDALCRRDLMDNVLSAVTTRWDMHWLEGADHGFHVLRSSGTSDAELLDEVGDVSQRWVAGLA